MTDQYRVLPGPDADTYRFLDRETFEPVVVDADPAGQDRNGLQSGYLVAADLDWTSERPTVDSLSVERSTLYEFVTDIDPMFEAAEETWADARADGDAMASRVTRNTDGQVNGVVYVFGEGQGRSRLAEFRDGSRPLEPLVDRVNEEGEPAPREVFVLRAPDVAFVAVVITFEKGGQFANTIRDTYDAPRPAEPLVE